MISKTKIGTDIIETQSFRQKPFEKNKNFYNSIFTESELFHCMKYSDPHPHFAGIFAAKEAIIKCLEKPVRMTDIEICWNDNGRPKAIIRSQKRNIDISISHTRSIALAVAIILL